MYGSGIRMPYKTEYGTHYHKTLGCHGATIPCNTAGLTPCSDCCNSKGEPKAVSTQDTVMSTSAEDGATFSVLPMGFDWNTEENEDVSIDIAPSDISILNDFGFLDDIDIDSMLHSKYANNSEHIDRATVLLREYQSGYLNQPIE